MLDHLADAESELRPKRISPAGSVEAPIQHLAQEDLEAYMNGQLAAARLKHCQTHLDSCEACRAELEDLRTLRSDSSSFSRSEPMSRELGRPGRRRKVTLPRVAVFGGILVAGISAVLWWRHERPQTNRNPVAVTVTPTVMPTVTPSPAPPAAGAQTRDTRLANQITALPEDNKKFALLGPFGEPIAETRPEFRWQPLPGAIRYSVAIVDARLHPVQHSHALRTTSWRPRRPLRPGIYLWQVTATLRGHHTVVASDPPPSEAVLRIIPRNPPPG